MKDLYCAIVGRYTPLVDRLLAIVIVSLVLVATGLGIYLLFVAIDSVGVISTASTTTMIEEKVYIPSHTSFLLAGKILIPFNHPQAYQLRVNINGRRVDFAVDKAFFSKVEVGEKIDVSYGITRLTRRPVPVLVAK